MNQEEYLDRLLDTQNSSRNRPSVDDDEIMASLAAAEMLTRLRDIDVPTRFAHRLELSIRARSRAHSLTHQHDQTISNSKIISFAPHRRSADARRSPKRRSWIALLGTAAVLVLAFTGLLALSAHSLPGGSLSQATPIPVNNQQNAASADMALLQGALVDLRTAVNDRRDDKAIQLALKAVATRTNDCRDAVATMPAGYARDAAQQNLDSVLAEEEQTVRQLLSQLDWPMRLLFTHQLGKLGDAVPTVTHATVHAQNNGTLLITLTGTHVVPQAELILDGQPKGTVSQVTAGQIVAIIRASQWVPGTRAFGILNPDGTADQFVLGGGDDHSRSGTPSPNNE